jgi:hypothetical protein
MQFQVDQNGAGAVPDLDYALGQASTMDATAKTLTLPVGCSGVRLFNSGAVTIFYRADGTAVATSGALRAPLGPGQFEIVAIRQDVNAASKISLVGASGDVYVTPVRT